MKSNVKIVFILVILFCIFCLVFGEGLKGNEKIKQNNLNLKSPGKQNGRVKKSKNKTGMYNSFLMF